MNQDDLEARDEGGEDDLEVAEDEVGEDDEDAVAKDQASKSQDDGEYCIDLYVVAKSMDHRQKILDQVFRASSQSNWAVVCTRTAHPSILLAAQEVCGEAGLSMLVYCCYCIACPRRQSPSVR